METQITAVLKFNIVECYKCGIKFGLPKLFRDHLVDNHNEFYCPNGHRQAFIGETEAERLQKELKRKEAELSRFVQEKLEQQVRAEKAEKKLRRVAKGVCPCCNRSFANLESHMKTKHPEQLIKK